MIHTRRARILAAIIAVQCWISLVLTTLDYAASADLVDALRSVFKLYTHMATGLIAVVFTAIAAGYRPIGRPAALGKTVVVAGILFVIYWTFGGYQNFLTSPLRAKFVHAILPAEVFLFWLAHGTRYRLKWTHPFLWTVFPLAYTTISLLYGMATGSYPYEFANIDRYGVKRVLGTVGLTVAGSMILGVTMVIFARYLHRISEERGDRGEP